MMSFILPCHLSLRGRVGRFQSMWILLLALLAGCVAPPQPSSNTPTANAAIAEPTPSATQQNRIVALLQQAETAASPERESLLLQVSAYYQQQGDYVRMARIFAELHPDTLTPPQHAEYSLQYGDWALNQRNPDAATAVLLDPSLDQGLSEGQTATLHSLRARLFERQGKALDALGERITQSAHTPAANQAEVSNAIWQLLKPMSAADLLFLENADARNPTEDKLLSGWLALAHIQREDIGSIDRLKTDIQSWRQNYLQHPANRGMPTEIAAVLEASSSAAPSTLRVALLLPLTGKRAAAGQAIRDGFMTMHYQQLAAGTTHAQIDLIDTGTVPDLLNTYQQAVAQGAKLVIGPLEREQVQLLAGQSSLPVPTLALNTPLDERQGPSALYQFSLNPEDDVAQVADAALANRFRRALVIAPQGERGERLTQAFLRRWQRAGGEATSVRYAPATGNYSVAIADGLGIDLASGQLRPGKSSPDMVFFVGSGSDASSVMEALVRNGAKDVPVYATAAVIDGRLDARTNGLRVCLPPWQVGAGPLQTAGLGVPAGGNAALFAMGADAEALYSQLMQWGGNTSLRVSGNTGYLGMDASRRVTRTQVWAVMQDGRPIAQPATTDGRF